MSNHRRHQTGLRVRVARGRDEVQVDRDIELAQRLAQPIRGDGLAHKVRAPVADAHSLQRRQLADLGDELTSRHKSRIQHVGHLHDREGHELRRRLEALPDNFVLDEGFGYGELVADEGGRRR
jgi:hypothetical protein